MKKLSTALGLALALGLIAPLAAQAEDLTVGKPIARFDKLTPSTRFYVRYQIVGDKRTLLDIWRRQVSFETKGGKRLMHIAQRWDGVGADPYVSLQDSWFEAGSFKPLSHERHVTSKAKTGSGDYRFEDGKVTGVTEVAGEPAKQVSEPLPLPAFNFETDMEFFQALPLAPGYEARVYFYDPGRDPADWYTFKVSAEDAIATPDGGKIDCWVLSTDYNKPGQYAARFWFAKATQVLMREETTSPDGSTLVKTLLNPEA